MKSVNTQFQQDAKKDKSGTGASQVVKWWAFDLLLFLKDKTTPRLITEAGVGVCDTRRIEVNKNTFC